MSVRRIGAALAAMAAVAAGVVALDQAGGAAAPAPVRTVALDAGVSAVWPQVHALSTSPAGTAFTVQQRGGPVRSAFLPAGASAPVDLGLVPGTDGPASVQGDVLAVPSGVNPSVDTVTFRTAPAGPALGSVRVGREDRYLGQAGAGALVAFGSPTGTGVRLVRRAPGTADVVLLDGLDGYVRLASDAAGVLLEVRTDRQVPQFTLRYVHFATGAVSTLAPAPVQGVVLEAGRVGWFAGRTLSLAPRTDPAAVEARTLPMDWGQFLSGDVVGGLRYDAGRQASWPYVQAIGDFDLVPSSLLIQGASSDNQVLRDLVPDGAGGFVSHLDGPRLDGGPGPLLPGLVRLRPRGNVTQLLTLPAEPAVAAGLSLSGGRAAWVDDTHIAGQARAQQVLDVAGTPVAQPPAQVGMLNRTAPTATHGLLTATRKSDGVVSVWSGNTSVSAPANADALPDGATVIGFDGFALVYRLGTRYSMLDTATGTITVVPVSDVDGGYRWSRTGVTGEVVRIPLAGGPAVRVLPPDPACEVTTVEARLGDLYVRCGAAQGRIYGPGATTPLLTFPADESTRLGSGILWRQSYREDRTFLTATAYRTAGAQPVDVLEIEDSAKYTVDREGPWAARIDPAGRVHVSLVPGMPAVPAATRYVAVPPSRLLDTRQTGGPVAAGTDRTVQVAGAAGVSPTATAVAVTVTVVRPSAAGWVAAYPAGGFAGTSTTNFATGQTVSAFAMVPLRDGRIALRISGGAAHVLVDVAGYQAAPWFDVGGIPVPLPPTRLLDTRTTGGAVQAGAPRVVPVAGRAGVPASARAVLVNATAVGPSASSWLSVTPGADSTPVTTVSYAGGRNTADLAVVPLQDGALTLRVGAGSTHVLLDVAGYVTAGPGGRSPTGNLHVSGPARLLDTRLGAGTPVAAGQDLKVQVTGSAGVPVGTTAVLANVTVVRPTATSWVAAYPTGSTVTTSTLNYASGQTVANAALVPLAADGSLSLRVGGGATHVLVDVTGYLRR